MDSNPFARSIFIINDLRMNPTFGITFSHNKSEAVTAVRMCSKMLQGTSIALAMLRELPC